MFLEISTCHVLMLTQMLAPCISSICHTHTRTILQPSITVHMLFAAAAMRRDTDDTIHTGPVMQDIFI